ncbi:hypothetical protein [Thermosporothrix hazakensis]|nr:hypothetical protein [Thermosporothrix hazakensis]
MPCPHCGAPSPLSGGNQGNQWGMVSPVSASPGNTAFPVSPVQQNDAYPWEQVPQLSFGGSPVGPAADQDTSAQFPPQMQFPSQDAFPPPQIPFSSQENWSGIQEQQDWNAVPQGQDGQVPVSLLPVPAQDQMQPAGSTSTLMMPMQRVEEMLPALPEQEGSVYIPPMYTKPRPLIPRYRIISGVLSVLIVALLLCGGVSYYAKASGKLDAFQRFIGISAPPALQLSPTATIGNPKPKEAGPAKDAVTLALLAAKVDENGEPFFPNTVFLPNTEFYLVANVVQQKNPSTISVKIFTNGQPYKEYEEDIQAKSSKSDLTKLKLPLKFLTPLAGHIEIYWEGKLAWRIYFAVK